MVGHKISNSTIESLKKAYIKELHGKHQEGYTESITKLPKLKHGRLVLLRVEIDSQVQFYLQKVRQLGGMVSSRVAMAAARGILMSTDKHKLVEFGGYVNVYRLLAAHLILNWDQTIIKFVPSSSWTMKKEGSKRIEVGKGG